MLHGTTRNPLLQVFDGRSKTRNILPQQKIAKSCDARHVTRAYTGQLSAQRLLRENLLLRVVSCNITLDLAIAASFVWFKGLLASFVFSEGVYFDLASK